MMNSSRFSVHPRARERGSALMTALLFALIIAISLTSYLKLATNSLSQAHRTFFADAASNMAETGLEEAVWAFNTMGNNNGNATVIASAWSNFTLTGSVADAVINSYGTGYTSTPTVTLSGGGGSGATAVATVGSLEVVVGNTTTTVNGVAAITITNPGSGYTSAPTITITGGGGSGATAVARLAATKTISFGAGDLDQNATGTDKVWVAGYDGTTNAPIIVSKATITPFQGPAVTKYIKVIVSKNGMLPKGVIAKYTINWNGHPFADSFISSTTPGVPPFTNYNVANSRSNTTVASISGPTVDLSHGTVDGNVMLGAGVTLTGGTVNGQKINNFTGNVTMPTWPTYSVATGYYNLGTALNLPTSLPRAGDTVASDGNYYYFVSGPSTSNNCVIGNVTVAAGKSVVIVGTNTSMQAGLKINYTTTPQAVGNCTIYMDGPITLSGNDTVNPSCWAGALKIFTTTSSDCTFSGNAQFYGCLTAPNAALVGNGGGSNQQDLSGSFVVNSVTSNGHMNFHYDEGLSNLTTGKPWSLALWKELEDNADRALYVSDFNF